MSEKTKEGLELTADALYQECRDAVAGKRRIQYSGTDANEYVKETFGQYRDGEGIALEMSNSHGLTLLIRRDDGQEFWLDPFQVQILMDPPRPVRPKRWRSIDDE